MRKHPGPKDRFELPRLPKAIADNGSTSAYDAAQKEIVERLELLSLATATAVAAYASAPTLNNGVFFDADFAATFDPGSTSSSTKLDGGDAGSGVGAGAGTSAGAGAGAGARDGAGDGDGAGVGSST